MEILYINTACLYNKQVFQEKLDSLSSKRQDKISSYRFDSDKILSLAAGLLLDEGLKRRGCKEKELNCKYNRQGKPFYPQLPDFHFNLAHSGQYAAAVFAEQPVGIDIEKIRPEINLAFAERFFHPAEYALLKNTAKELRCRLFFQIWTLKESYAKASGRGGSLPFDAFCVSALKEEFSIGEAYLRQYFLIPDYCMSVCCLSPCAEKKLPHPSHIQEIKF